MPEKTKEELSEEINKILGTTIDLTKLTKDDLTALQEALLKFKEASEFPLPLIDKPIGEILDKKVFNKPLRETSLREILGLPKEGKGLLGLGLTNLPRLRERLEERKSESKA
jgi:hypothetical protein